MRTEFHSLDSVIVVRTVPGSAAERAGLRGVNTTSGELGDVVVAADGKPLHRLPDLTDELEQAGIGKTVNLTLDRGGNRIAVSLRVADAGKGR